MAGTFDALPVWTIPPDWSNGILERLAWLTDVLKSQSGAEQRRKLRLTPRRTFELGFHARGAQRALYDLSIKAAGASDWYVPLWHDIIRTAGALAAGSGSNFAVATPGHEYAVGGLAILYGDVFNYEIVVIGAVASDSVTFTAPVAANWPAGTRFMPVMRSMLTAEPQTSRLTDNTVQGMISWQGTGPNLFTPDLGGLPSYGGFPVLTLPPSETDNLTETYQRLTSLLDNTTGKVKLTDTAGFGFTSKQYRWWVRGLAQNTALRKLLYALAGRWSAVWVPTFAQDLELTAPVNHADTAITVKRCGYTDFGGSTLTGRKDIVFQLADGTNLYRGVVASANSEDGLTETLGLSSPTGADLGVSFVKRISFMSLSRQDSDQIEIAHQSDANGASVAATVFREAPDLRVLQWDAFNPEDVIGGVISDADQTITNLIEPMLVRTKHGKNTGKFYFEGSYANYPSGLSSGMALGICTKAATVAEVNANAVNAIAMANYGIGSQILALGVGLGTPTSNTFGGFFSLPCIAVDLDAQLFWGAPNESANYNQDPAADPATGVGGISFAALGSALLYPCAFGNNQGHIWTINLGSTTFARAVPRGFHAGWPAF